MGPVAALAARFVDEIALVLKPLATKRRQRRRMVLVDRGGVYDCYRVSGQDTRLVDSGPIEMLADKLRHGPVELRLGPEQVVWNNVSLPRSSQDFLEPVLRHQLERLTPWTADRAAFDYAVSEDPGGRADQISVSLVATSRELLNAALGRLEPFGIRPIAIGTAEDPIEQPPTYDLLSDGDSESLNWLRRKVIACLMAALIVGGGLGVYTSWQLAGIQARAGELATAVAGRQSLINDAVQRAAAAREGHRLASGKRQTMPMVLLINELSAILPDDTYLTELTVEPSAQLRLSGLSAEASRLIALLESSHIVTDVEFSAPITRAGDTGRESFQIVARLRTDEE